MTVYFTSDLHLGHARMAELRGFGDDIARHDATVLDLWDVVVRPDDVVYVLGDLTMARPEQALAELRGLPGRKRLILGNHDAGHPMHRSAHRWTAAYADVFEHVAASARIKVCGREVLLSHFPYGRDRGEPRYLQWRLPYMGLPLLHGHTHGPERLTSAGGHLSIRSGAFTAGPCVEVHVGLDAWGLSPVSDVEVAALLDEGSAWGA